MKRQLEPSKFFLVGNNLSVDFVNTRIRVTGVSQELLESFEDLVAWAVRAELLNLSQARPMLLIKGEVSATSRDSTKCRVGRLARNSPLPSPVFPPGTRRRKPVTVSNHPGGHVAQRFLLNERTVSY